MWKRGGELLEFAERKTYLGGIQDAIAGADAARVVLLRARERIDEQAQRLAMRQAAEARIRAGD